MGSIVEQKDGKTLSYKDVGSVLNQGATLASMAASGKRSYTAGILGGAGTGATLGSTFGPWSAAVGGVVGGIAGGIGTAVGKKNDNKSTDDQDLRENIRLKNKALKQAYEEKQRQIEWMTKLRNQFKYR